MSLRTGRKIARSGNRPPSRFLDPMSTKNSALQLAIDEIAIPNILIDHRVIASGDKSALLPEELGAFAASVIKVQRASGAARIVARTL